MLVDQANVLCRETYFVSEWPKIYFKRDELNHTGHIKLIMLLDKFISEKDGKKRIIAETGAGQHGVQQQQFAPDLA